MYYCLNAISKTGLEGFREGYEETEEINEAEGILVRSADMKEMQFSKSLKAVARAGAGVNNIPLVRCADQGIVVFNTPGANANAVKELVLAGMLLASRDLSGGMEWVKANAQDEAIAKTTEKAKKAFAGHELAGKKLGVIGLGAIGAKVANAAVALGMDVYGYDPYLSVNAAWNISSQVHHSVSLDEICEVGDYITIHVPAMESTKGLIGREQIAKMKPEAVVLNFARDVLVDEQAMKEALDQNQIARYVTDFPNTLSVSMKQAIVIPHLGASTEESEENCAKMAVHQMQDYLDYGTIRNSVNYPDCDMGECKAAGRVAVLHKNVPNMLGQITAVLGAENINISDLINKSRGDYAYTLIDIENACSEEAREKLAGIEHILRVRIVK